MDRTVSQVIIASHPEEDSFTCAVASRYAETVKSLGHEPLIRNLYRPRFDPVLQGDERQGTPAADVDKEWALLGKPDVVVLVYPIWFGSMPAMLKGYIDRVFGAGRIRGLSAAGSSGELLAGKRLVSFTSSGSQRAWLDDKGVLGSLRTIYDRYFAEVFGFSETHHFHFEGISNETPVEEIRAHLADCEAAARDVVRAITGGPPDIHPNRR